MTQKEKNIVNRALSILEQYQDDEAKELAMKLLEQGQKVPLQKVGYYASYCQGIREAYERIFDKIEYGNWLVKVSKKDCPYFKAEKELVESNVRACYDYHVGRGNVMFKDFKSDKKGNLLSCRAALVRTRNVDEEIMYDK